jgi:hypothetical protein
MKTRSGTIFGLNSEKKKIIKRENNLKCKDIFNFILDIIFIALLLNGLFLILYMTQQSVTREFVNKK